MTRYFYSDPYSAAYMAKQFGMRFNNGDGERDIAGDIDDGISNEYDLDPGSLTMLEPQPDDLVYVLGEYQTVPEVGQHFMLDYCRRVIAANLKPHATGRIIQRGGKPFHWPEQA